MDLLIQAHYSVLMYPRGSRRKDILLRLTQELEVYRVVVDPTRDDDLMNQEIDFVIFSKPVTLSGDVVPVVIVLATWGDSLIKLGDRFKVYRYIDDVDELQVLWEPIPIPLTQHQLLYYDHLATSGCGKEKLHAVSLFAGSHETMAGYVTDDNHLMSVGEIDNSRLYDHSSKIDRLNSQIKDLDLVFSSNPRLVDSLLRPCVRTLISGTDGREFVTNTIHLLDSWSPAQITDLLTTVRVPDGDKLKMILYVAHHPHRETVDSTAYTSLSEKLEELDLGYERGRNSPLVIFN